MLNVAAELQALHKKLEAFPTEAHWFCPKCNDNDDINYDDPNLEEDGVSVEVKKQRIADARKRLEIAYHFTYIFGISTGDLDEADEWRDDYKKHITGFLTSCHKCIWNYHLERRDFLKELTEEFDDEIVNELSTRIEQFDFQRIDSGLLSAEHRLRLLPESRRNMRYLVDDPVALSGLFEALCCDAYHKSEEKLFQPLGDVMNLVQTTKVLRLGVVFPAMTRFLFDGDRSRHTFAITAWQTTSRIDDSRIFDWVVHDALTDAIYLVIAPTSTLIERERFWYGIALILEKLESDIIIHSLRGMEVQPDIYHLALEHLACDSVSALNSIIRVLSLLLSRSRETFWAAFGTISPATIAEQIFNSPAFDQLLARSPEVDFSDAIHLPDAISWVPPFVDALPPNHQHDACRFVLFNLLSRLQDGRNSRASRLACCHAGLRTLLNTLRTFTTRDYEITSPTAFIHIDNVLGLVEKYKDTIVNCAMLSPENQDDAELYRLALQVIQQSLYLDCRVRNAEYQLLAANIPVDHGLDSPSKLIWQAVLDSFRPDNVEMAKTVLSGITPLTGLEKFKLTNESTLIKDKTRFNEDFGKLTDIVAYMLERLSDFTPVNIRQLCSSLSTSQSLFAALTSADEPTYEAAVEVIKTVTGEERRKDAIFACVREFLGISLTAMATAAKKINSSRGFTAVPRVLKTGRDVLESLCDSQVGLLRITSSRSSTERQAISEWWTWQWETVETSFGMTEKWSKTYSSEVLINFCRDVMEYAEALFDQYNLLVTVLSSDSEHPEGGSSSTAVDKLRKKILQSPRKAIAAMVKWLRLKDPYLLSTVVSLLTKLLRRLGEFDMEIDESAARYIDAAARVNEKEGVRTFLTAQQKAELIKALEEHQGLEVVEKPSILTTIKRQKQSTIDMWSRPAGDGRQKFSGMDTLSNQREMVVRNSNAKPSQLDFSQDIRSLSSTIDKERSVLDQMRSRQQNTLQSQSHKGIGIKAGDQFKQSREREKEEKRIRDAAAVAKARALRTGGLVKGEGSGLKGLGVLGKDHAPPKGEIMVSSEEESSEDESEVSTLIVKTKDISKKATEQEEARKRALKQLAPQGPVRKQKIVRSAKDIRARLIPDMSALHLNILMWNIFHEGEEPPSSVECSKVSDTFQTHLDYRNTFYPLLISEAWRSFNTAKEENSSRPFPIKVVNRMSIDHFYEVSTTMAIAENRDTNLMEGDIVLLSKAQHPLKDPTAAHCLARIFRITRKKDILEISYRVNGTAANGVGANGTPILPHLAPNTTVQGYKITSMTTIEREYAALNSLQFYDLCEEILEGKPSPLLPYSRQVLEPIQRNYAVNMGQAKAIWSARENDAFTLIQGPPGSGKTKTIVAMVGALLTDSLASGGVAIERPQSLKPASNTKPMQKKLLVCAPSNAAVDELVMRLKEGVKTLKGDIHKINVIRLGRSDAINSSVRDVTLDELVRLKLEGESQAGKGVLSEHDRMHKEAGQIKEQLSLLRPQLEEARAKGDRDIELRLQRDFDNKKREQARIGAKIDADKDSGNTVARENEINRRRWQQQILDSAHVICATLSGSGHEMFKNLNVEFETVIIDEAAQCIELSALIPLKYGCSKCILVGDPKQLPPTVLSRMAARYGYEQSLFVRMQQNYPQSVHLLDTQYRMHPEISHFPSRQFYEAKLVDGEGMAALRKKPWHANPLLGPYRFFDVKGTQATGSKGHSYVNVEEINIAIQLYERLKAECLSYEFRGQVGIITPYKAQLAELRNRFRSRYGDGIFDEIDFNTTDAFQGRESEVIIFSCVRARATGGIGFLDDIRRMNVGLTRAKSSLWVLGDSQSLIQGEFWGKLIKDAESRQVYTKGDISMLLRKSLPKNREYVSVQARAASVDTKTPTTIEKSTEMSRLEDIEMTDAPDTCFEVLAGSESGMMHALPSVQTSVSVHDTQSSSKLEEAMMNEALSRQKPNVQDTTSTPSNRPALASSAGGHRNGSTGKRERPRSADGGGPQKKKIPTGPRALSGVNSRPPNRVHQRQDVTALSLLNSAKSTPPISDTMPDLASSTGGTGPQAAVSSIPTRDVERPRVFKKRPAADPLRRNLHRPR